MKRSWIEKERAMKRIDSLFATCFLLAAISMAQAQQTTDVESIQSASQRFVAAIGARDINAMDKVWAHESYASFAGPFSTTIVIGWEDVREAWQMRFGQFDRVTISADKPHVRVNGQAAWAVGMERVELLRKDGRAISFDAFVTNVFENKGGRWLLVAHQATPVFRAAE
jgi:ketosteroid isomerase-like protein